VVFRASLIQGAQAIISLRGEGTAHEKNKKKRKRENNQRSERADQMLSSPCSTLAPIKPDGSSPQPQTARIQDPTKNKQKKEKKARKRIKKKKKIPYARLSVMLVGVGPPSSFPETSAGHGRRSKLISKKNLFCGPMMRNVVAGAVIAGLILLLLLNRSGDDPRDIHHATEEELGVFFFFMFFFSPFFFVCAYVGPYIRGEELLRKDPGEVKALHGFKIIHQSWKKEKLPKGIIANCFNSWAKNNPSALHVLWTDYDNLLLVQKHYPEFLGLYNSLPMNIMRADLVS
jgi:hypothetical protein